MLAHFYHVYADGAWQDPLAEHLAALDASGLGAALDVRAAGIVGTPGNCQAAITALGPGWQIAVTARSGHEDVTLRALHAFAALDGKAFYAHTKAAADDRLLHRRLGVRRGRARRRVRRRRAALADRVGVLGMRVAAVAGLVRR
jgi:predicted phosphoribosyltransferase